MSATHDSDTATGSDPPLASPPPCYASLNLKTFNINRMFTKILRGKKKFRKYSIFSKYLMSVSINIACMQEHHATSPEEEGKLKKHFDRLGYHLMLNYNAAGRGGVGLVWKHSHICQEATALDCRLLVARFMSLEWVSLTNFRGNVSCSLTTTCLWSQHAIQRTRQRKKS